MNIKENSISEYEKGGIINFLEGIKLNSINTINIINQDELKIKRIMA